MPSVHHYLCRRSLRYHRWHKLPYHQHHHWLFFALVFLIGAYAITGAWDATVRESDWLISFEPRIARAQALPAVTICPWNGEGVKLASGVCNNQSGNNCSFEVSAIDQVNSPSEWAQLGCLGGAAPCVSLGSPGCSATLSDGLTYAAFLVNGAGGFIRYNANPSGYNAVVVVHQGGGGIFWNEDPRNEPAPDTTDWQNLQDAHGMRVVGVKWADVGVNYNNGQSPAGRFTRNSNTPSSWAAMWQRPAAIAEWIDQNLNPQGKPLGITGSSGGADQSLAPFLTNSPLAQRIDYLGPASYATVYNYYNPCVWVTPPGTLVNPATGVKGTTGFGVSAVGNGAPIAFIDDLWNLVPGAPGCANKYNLTNPPATLAAAPLTAQTRTGIEASSAEHVLQQLLDSGVPGFTGTLHASVGTNSAGNNDNNLGVTWAGGNLMAHPYFASAKKKWSECPQGGHGAPLDANLNGPGCFDEIYNELIASLGSSPLPFPLVTVSASDPTAAEPSDDGTFTVSRTGSTTSSLNIGYNIANTNAASGSDFNLMLGTVVLGGGGSFTIPVGSTSVQLTVKVLDDTEQESSENVVVNITPSSSYTVASPPNATVTIADNDSPVDTTPPSFAPDSRGFSAGPPQSSGAFTISWLVLDNVELDKVVIKRAPYSSGAVQGASTHRSFWRRILDLFNVFPTQAQTSFPPACDENSKSLCQWIDAATLSAPANSISWLSSTQNTPPAPGKWWYGIWVWDTAGNNKIEPTPPGPFLVEQLAAAVGSDLVASSITLSNPNPIPGSVIIFSGTLKNIGSAQAGASDAVFCVDSASGTASCMYNQGGMVGDYIPISPLASQMTSPSFSSTVPWDAVLGNHIVYLCADPNDSVLEAQGTDTDTSNCLTKTFTVSTTGSQPPTTPVIDGAPSVSVNQSTGYRVTSSTVPAGGDIEYFIDWGDGTTTNWTQPYTSGQPHLENHAWSTAGTKFVKAKARDANQSTLESLWATYQVTVGAVTGNCDFTASVNVSKSFQAVSQDPGDQLAYEFLWGDSDMTRIPGSGFTVAGQAQSASHAWQVVKSYIMTVKATDDGGLSAQTSKIVCVQ